MKKTIQSLFIMGLSLNSYALLANAELAKQINEESKQSYMVFSTAERTKRNLRYCTAGLGLLGIGGLIYYSWRTDALQEEGKNILDNYAKGKPISKRDKAKLDKLIGQGYYEAFKNLKAKIEARKSKAASVLSWSSTAKNYIMGTLKSSASGAIGFGAAMVTMGLQGFGASMFLKGILSPLANKLVATYSINRFIANKTKLNQNIKDLVFTLVALDKEEVKDVEAQTKRFEITFDFLRKDVINILGFMMYIWTLVRTDDLLASKAKNDFNQVKKCLLGLLTLNKDNSRALDEYKELLNNLVNLCESFSGICDDAGTDYLEDYYDSLFDQLKQSVNIDLQMQMAPEPDMGNLQQMLELAESFAAQENASQMKL